MVLRYSAVRGRENERAGVGSLVGSDAIESRVTAFPEMVIGDLCNFAIFCRNSVRR